MPSLARPVRVALGLGALAAGTGVLAWLALGPDAPTVSEADRALGLDQATVYFHVALRRDLHDSPSRATDLLGATTSRAEAERWADALLDARVDGVAAMARGEEVGPILGDLGSELGLHDERAAILFALVAQRAKETRHVPPHVAVYEASRIDPTQIDEALVGLVHAARALVYSGSELCERARAEAAASAGGPSAADLEGTVENPGAVAEDLEQARRFLIDGAIACCAVREGEVVEAAKRMEASASDAMALGVAPERVAIVRAFAATARGDREAARALVNSVRAADLGVADRERHRMVRDALASGGEHGLADAMVRLVDSDWLLALVLEGAVDALERDGLRAALEGRRSAKAALDFVDAEAAVYDAARSLDPIFYRAPSSTLASGDPR